MVSLSPALVRQAVRFGIVGVGNTLLTYVLTLGLTSGASLAVAPASALGYAAGVAQSFVLNRFWTFGVAPGGSRAVTGQLAGFIIVNLLCGGLFTLVTTVAAPRLGLAPATLLGVVIATPVNFVLTRRFVFAVRER
ncbi:MAG: GtrA family protein [Sandarakinorhabdus sp.]|nr:GtrA family protein [Sandarakinorhabdus sp.]